MRSIGTKLFAVLFVIVGLLSATLGLFSYFTAQSAIVDQAKTGSMQTISLTGEKLDMKLRFFLDAANQIVGNSEFQEQLFQFANAGRMREEELNSRMAGVLGLLDQIKLSEPRIRDITLVPLVDPVPMMSTDRQAANPDAEADWMRSIRGSEGKPVWLPIEDQGYLGNSPKPLFAYGKLLGKKNIGSNDFVLLVQIESTVLQEMIQGVKLGEQSAVAIYDGTGRPVSTDGSSGQRLDLSGAGGAVSDTRSYVGADKRLVAYRTSSVTGWILAGFVPLSELTSAADRIRDLTFVVIAASVVVAVLVGIWLVRMISKPLGQLKLLMRRAADGDLRGRMATNRRDEIGDVSVAYNQMSEQIGTLVSNARRSVDEVAGSSLQMANAAQRTANSAHEIHWAAAQIAQGAAGLATNAEQSGDNVGMMGIRMGDARELHEKMEGATRVVDELCNEGGAIVEGLLVKTRETDRHFRSLADRVNGLSDSAASIQGILKLITQMAKQTTILSLNAAIEASREGQAGGMKAIADEIRRVAEQSHASIGQVEQLAMNIRSEVDSSVGTMRETEPFFREMTEGVGSVHRLFRSVREMMEQLKARLDEVSVSLVQLHRSHHTIRESIEEVSAVSEEASASADQVAALTNAQKDIGLELVQVSEDLKRVSARLEQQMSSFLV
ncbi:methyl-accepting chemotaxis protein [Cohnella cholangitidis]|uniref:Methyl-accepting chemotaxis protein n=1 Tax=Cohnella cholangitidis TaxID=2598458 RepID=A0A7G5C1V6_9BACL|nr:methyl-accepting chemotaxis protein [Cohnella cholangitidis]QMV43190.1 methyl-accepting chemotaxis protein [Cohnella cholangitidis]